MGEETGISKTDSLRKELSIQHGKEKISTQLELSIQLLNNKEESLSLANSALDAAKKRGDKTLEMRSCLTLGRVYQSQNKIDQAIEFYDSAFALSKEIDDSWYKGEILFRKGVLYHNSGNDIRALGFFNSAIRACLVVDNYKIIGSSYSMMGTIFRVNGIYDRAIEYIIKSKLNYQKAGFEEGNAWCAYLLGQIYADLQDPENALEYFKEALVIYLKLAAIDGNYNGVGICYQQIGILEMQSGNLDEAQINIENVLDIYAKSGVENGISSAYKSLGQIKYLKGDCNQAEEYLNKALEMKNELGEMLSIPGIYEYLGLCKIDRGKINEGLDLLQKGLALAETNNQKKIQIDIYAKLSETYLKLKNLEKAVTYQDKQIEVQNSLLSGTANIKMEQLQRIYEIDEKNSQIAELENENEIISLKFKQQKNSQIFMIIGILVILFISITTFWFYNKIRHKNEELHLANKAKDKFFAIISHDLRGPVGTLSTFLGEITSHYEELDAEEIKEILENLQKSSENASNLLENLLAWARSQADKIDYNPTEIQLSEVLNMTLDGLKHVADNKQIRINTETNEQINVLADPDMLQTIIRNLVSNAIKFSNRGGSISIHAGKNGDSALISVADKGVGIEKEAISKIFDINDSHHTPGTEDEKSSGLGLILVKDFVERNKGELNIESEAGKGTVVSFTLPLA